MELIIGGAYQGKLEYAKKKYGVSDADVCECDENGNIVFFARCIDSFEKYVLYCVRNGKDAVEELKKHASEWSDSVIICCDIFCGIVPLDATMRQWREACGRACAYLSGEAAGVTRLFCSVAQKLK